MQWLVHERTMYMYVYCTYNASTLTLNNCWRGSQCIATRIFSPCSVRYCNSRQVPLVHPAAYECHRAARWSVLHVLYTGFTFHRIRWSLFPYITVSGTHCTLLHVCTCKLSGMQLQIRHTCTCTVGDCLSMCYVITCSFWYIPCAHEEFHTRKVHYTSGLWNQEHMSAA